jgi:hypothetical protein
MIRHILGTTSLALFYANYGPNYRPERASYFFE